MGKKYQFAILYFWNKWNLAKRINAAILKWYSGNNFSSFKIYILKKLNLQHCQSNQIRTKLNKQMPYIYI